jgi:putative peptidoglycan lipid II flippase
LALVLLAQPLVAVLFHYGKFSNHDVLMTQGAVATYSLGLIGFSLIKILAPAFYAQQNIKTPVKIAIAVLIVGQIANVFTVPWLGHAGLALSISLGALLNAALLYWGLRRRVNGVSRFTPHAAWFKYSIQLSAGLVTMGAWLWWAVPQLNWLALQVTPWLRVAYLMGVCSIGASLYFASLAVCGVKLRAFARRV